MNLDEVKQAWQNQTTHSKKLSEADLMDILKKPSMSPVVKMKRNLKSEWLFYSYFIFYHGYLLFYFVWFGDIFLYPFIYLTFALLFFIYYQYKNKLLNKMICVNCHLKSNLGTQVNVLEKLVRNYLVAGTMICTAAIIFIFAIEYYLSGSTFLHNTVFIFSKGDSVLLYIISIFATVILLNQLNYWANKWYLNKLYGKHIQHLKELLNQLNED